MPKYKSPLPTNFRITSLTPIHSSVGFLSLYLTLTTSLRTIRQLNLNSTGDYCDVYLTHDSMSVRKAHNSGRNHERNVLDYYQRTSTPFLFPLDTAKNPRTVTDAMLAEIGHEKAQSVIDSITSSYAAEGQAGANPMLAPQGGPPPAGAQGFPPPGFGFPGTLTGSNLYSSPSFLTTNAKTYLHDPPS